MKPPRDIDVAFVYRHYFTGEMMIASVEDASDISRSRGCHDWIHINTINPVRVLNNVVRAKGRERAKIIRDIGKKP